MKQGCDVEWVSYDILLLDLLQSLSLLAGCSQMFSPCQYVYIESKTLHWWMFILMTIDRWLWGHSWWWCIKCVRRCSYYWTLLRFQLTKLPSSLHSRKQSELWLQGDIFRSKSRKTPKLTVTKILTGVDDISINDSKNQRAHRKETELVNSRNLCCCKC